MSSKFFLGKVSSFYLTVLVSAVPRKDKMKKFPQFPDFEHNIRFLLSALNLSQTCILNSVYRLQLFQIPITDIPIACFQPHVIFSP